MGKAFLSRAAVVPWTEESHGRLRANGYITMPISHGGKKPAHGCEWRQLDISSPFLFRYPPHCGIGFITGRGERPLVLIDVDVPIQSLADMVSAYADEVIGGAPVRVGNAPKFGVLCRLEDVGTRKKSSAVFTGEGVKAQIEILADGQYFVGYGIHPTTCEPYKWYGGDPLSVKAGDLPVVTEDQILGLIEFFEARAASMGLVQAGGGCRNSESKPKNTEIERGEESVSPTIKPLAMRPRDCEHVINQLDPDDREVWLKVGSALHHQFAGADTGYWLWSNWSYRSAKFKAEEITQMWQYFGRCPDKRANMISLMALARAGP